MLHRVKLGEVIITTRNVKPIAKLVPDTGGFDSLQAYAANQRIRARAHQIKAGPFDWDALKNDRDAGRP